VLDEPLCYKIVVKLLEKAAKREGEKTHLNLFFILSEILRLSRTRLGSGDKYGESITNITAFLKFKKLRYTFVHDNLIR
jgi:hypothetical protein